MTPSEFYNKYVGDRSQYEDRAEKYAKLTVPSIFRDKSWSSSSVKEDNYVQSYGAMCVKNFVSKVGMSLFPPNSSAFRFSPDSDALNEMTQGDVAIRDEIFKEISISQTNVNKYLEAMNTRKVAFEVLDHSTVVSSCVVERVKKKNKTKYKIHSLRNFVVKLDENGNEWAIVVREVVRTLPDNITVSKEKEEYELYTKIELDRETDKWIMTQDIDGELVGDEKSFNDDNRPFAYMGWLYNSGDDYYRPYVEDYEGDLNAINLLSKVLTKGSLISSKNLTFVDERGGRTRLRDVKTAANGAILQGRADDVTSYQHGKNYDYQAGLNILDKVEKRLAFAFLLQEGLRRDAERVTAEEMRMLAKEVETALASIYAIASQKIIKRFVVWAMDDLKIKFNAIDVEIITGLDALGRAVEATKLDNYVTRGSQIGYIDRLNMAELATRYASYDNIETEGLLMSEAEYTSKKQKEQQELAAMQGQQSFANQAGANTANALTNQ